MLTQLVIPVIIDEDGRWKVYYFHKLLEETIPVIPNEVIIGELRCIVHKVSLKLVPKYYSVLSIILNSSDLNNRPMKEVTNLLGSDWAAENDWDI